MKKVTVATMATMVLITATSAFAADNVTGATNAVRSIASYTTLTIGAGGATTGNAGGAAIMIDAALQYDDEIGARISAEASRNYSNIVVKPFSPISDFAYLGVGYLNAKAHPAQCTTNEVGESVCQSTGTNMGASGAPSSSTSLASGASGSNLYTEKGVYGMVGLTQKASFDGMNFTADAGYRFGKIQGPVGSLGFSTKISEQIVGFKLSAEQIKNDTKNINRTALYATFSF